MGDVMQAKEIYKQILKKFPKNRKALLGYQALKVPSKSELDHVIGVYREGRFKEAIILADRLSGQYPTVLVFYDILSTANMELGRFDKAIEICEKALKLDPNHTDAYNNLGMARYTQGRFEEAKLNYQQVVRLEPNFSDGHYNLGNAFGKLGELRKAIEAYKVSLSLNPDDAEVLLNYGNALHDYGSFDQAIDCYSKALTLNSSLTNVQTNICIATEKRANIEKQIADYTRVIEKQLSSAEKFTCRGTFLYSAGYREAAIDNFKRAIEAQPNFEPAYFNMGNVYKELGKLDAAVLSYKQAVKIKPDYAVAYLNMGVVQKEKGDLDTSIDCYNQAIKIQPDDAEAHCALSFALLNQGKLREGLDEYEWRWRTADFLSQERHFPQPMWDGSEVLKGRRILLWGEQGPGDVVMWSSCVSLVASQAKHCILECQEKLIPLFTRSFPNIEVKAENRSSDNRRNDFDLHLPMGSLFRHFISEISNETKLDAFLIPDPDRVNFWKERLNLLGKKPFIGISWTSPVVTPKRLPNYTQISEWAPVLALPDVTFINLQCSEFRDDLAAIHLEFGTTVHYFDDLNLYDDLDDVAALSAALDIAVSVSTAVSTITAGVGTPTKMLHWRQSPWNNILLTPRGPFVDVFERNTWEAWDNVFHSVAKDIADY